MTHDFWSSESGNLSLNYLKGYGKDQEMDKLRSSTVVVGGPNRNHRSQCNGEYVDRHIHIGCICAPYSYLTRCTIVLVQTYIICNPE